MQQHWWRRLFAPSTNVERLDKNRKRHAAVDIDLFVAYLIFLVVIYSIGEISESLRTRTGARVGVRGRRLIREWVYIYVYICMKKLG